MSYAKFMKNLKDLCVQLTYFKEYILAVCEQNYLCCSVWSGNGIFRKLLTLYIWKVCKWCFSIVFEKVIHSICAVLWLLSFNFMLIWSILHFICHLLSTIIILSVFFYHTSKCILLIIILIQNCKNNACRTKCA